MSLEEKTALMEKFNAKLFDGTIADGTVTTVDIPPGRIPHDVWQVVAHSPVPLDSFTDPTVKRPPIDLDRLFEPEPVEA